MPIPASTAKVCIRRKICASVVVSSAVVGSSQIKILGRPATAMAIQTR